MAVFNKCEYSVSTRVMARLGRLPSKEDYKILASSQSLTDIVTYVKELFKTKENISETGDGFDRNNIEQYFYANYYRDLSQLFSAGFTMGSHLFDLLLANYESEMIMQYSRLFNAGHLALFSQKVPDFILKHLPFDLRAVSTLTKPYELLEMMEKSPLKKCVTPFFAMDIKVIDLPNLEVALKRFVFETAFLLENETMNKKDKKDFLGLYLSLADLYNIRTIYRAKRFYNMPDDMIKKQLLPFYKNLKKKKLDELCASSIEQIESFIRLNRSLKLDVVSFDEIDKAVEKRIFDICRKTVRFSSGSAAVLSAYMNLRKIHLNSLTTVVEGVRYQMPPDEILKLLPMF